MGNGVGSISKIDLTTRTVLATANVEGGASGIALNSLGEVAYVASPGAGGILVFST
jgi:DNA-binding beta-propeller fold protein YncE